MLSGDIAEDPDDESNSEKPDDDHPPLSNGSGQLPLSSPSTPLVDYAIDGYEGDNMDGIG